MHYGRAIRKNIPGMTLAKYIENINSLRSKDIFKTNKELYFMKQSPGFIPLVKNGK